MTIIRFIHLILILTFTTLYGCTFLENRQREIKLSASVPEIEHTRAVNILTVFFGLDNALPRQARLLYKNAFGKDGMPVVFSHEIVPNTLDASDFEVITKNGKSFPVEAVTLLPAEEEFELRTVLLIGEYGNHPDNPPVLLKIKDDLLTRTGSNYKGQTKKIIPLEDGPTLSYAEYFSFDDDYPYVKKGLGCDCPKKATQTVVKAVWSGGVRATNGDELGDKELNAFKVTLIQENDTLIVTPFQLADLSDGDNNTDLCLKEKGIPILLEVDKNIAIDPRDDKNPRTRIAIKSRW